MSGSAICVPALDSFKATAQYIPAQNVQRLLYRLLSLFGNLLLPEEILDSGLRLFHLRARCQNECVAGLARTRLHLPTGNRC